MKRKYRNLPVKRGAIVRYPYRISEISGPHLGYVTSCPDGYVRASFPQSKGRGLTLHPYELDWQAKDGTWLKGKDLKAEYDAAWNAVNARWNHQVLTPENEAAVAHWVELGREIERKYGKE